VPPRVKKPDHFDLMTRFADSQDDRGDKEKADKTKAKHAAFRAGLDAQLDERSRQQEREEEDAKVWRETIKRQTEEHHKDEAEKERVKAERTLEMKRFAKEGEVVLAKRKQVVEEHQVREREELDRVLAADKTREANQAAKHREVSERRSKDARANFEVVAQMRETKKLALIEEDKGLAAEAKRRSEQQEAVANLGYKTRQAIVDAITSTMGESLRREEAKQAKNLVERVDVQSSQYETKRYIDYWDREEVRERNWKETEQRNIKVGAEVRTNKGVAEREADTKQSETWKKQDAEHHIAMRRKTEEKRLVRDRIDDELLQITRSNLSLHRSEIGVSDHMREREMSFHRPVLDRMAADGFQADVSGPLAMQATQLTATMKLARGTLKTR